VDKVTHVGKTYPSCTPAYKVSFEEAREVKTPLLKLLTQALK
jgi:hypothetical protein